jgi:hypothetical protein
MEIDKGVYKGEVLNGKIHGFGNLEYYNGN